jgi:hypothetical protein
VQDQDPAEPPSQAPLEPDDSAEPPASAADTLADAVLERRRACSPPCSIRRRFEAISEKRSRANRTDVRAVEQTGLTSVRSNKCR